MKKQFGVLTILSAFIILALFYVSCKKKDGVDVPDPKSNFGDFEYSGVLSGSMLSNGSSSTVDGYLTIAKDGAATIELQAGSMKGSSQKNGDTYAITITAATGMFKDVTNITGSVETTTGGITISGTNPGGTSLTITAKASAIPIADDGWDKLLKSSVYFTHNEDMLASVTIDGVTISGLNAHYHEGGLCDGYYSLWQEIPVNVDTQQSKIFCHSGVIQGLNNQPVSFTSCPTIGFVLDKNKEYTYMVQWGNGTTTTGKFTSPSGGRKLAVCISTSGSGGAGIVSGTINNEPFSFGGHAEDDSTEDGTSWWIQGQTQSNVQMSQINFGPHNLPGNNKTPNIQSYNIVDHNTVQGETKMAYQVMNSSGDNLVFLYFSSGQIVFSQVGDRWKGTIVNATGVNSVGTGETITVNGTFDVPKPE